MSDLRLILVIIGCFIVLGVYLWDVFQKKQRGKKADILNAVNETPDTPITPNADFSEEDYNKAISDLTELSAQLQNNSKASEPIINLNKEDSGENILTLYITAKKDTQFNGLAIKKILIDIGMVYGDMNIFHYYKRDIVSNDNSENEIKDKDVNKPFFSIANMYEPGTFSTEMEKLHTKGIAAFMYDIDSVNSYKIFESVFFVNIERIAKHLDGEISTSDQKHLDATSLKSIREKLRLFAMKDFLKNGSQ
jgi:cell division protein ZipA